MKWRLRDQDVSRSEAVLTYLTSLAVTKCALLLSGIIFLLWCGLPSFKSEASNIQSMDWIQACRAVSGRPGNLEVRPATESRATGRVGHGCWWQRDKKGLCHQLCSPCDCLACHLPWPCHFHHWPCHFHHLPHCYQAHIWPARSPVGWIKPRAQSESDTPILNNRSL